MLAPSRDVFIYLSLLLGKKIRDEKTGRLLGRFHEAAAEVVNIYPRIGRIFIRTKSLPWSNFQMVPWEAVRKFDLEGIIIDGGALQPIAGPTAASGEILLRDEVLDQQIVDVGGAKVVRVNDVHLLKADGQIIVAHVDVGTLGLVRRLGFERAFSRTVEWLFGYQMKERLVGWKHVQLIPEPEESPHRGMKLSLEGHLAELHPADLADIMEELDPRTREAVFKSLPLEAAADALEETEMEVQKGLIEAFTDEEAADIIEQMPEDAAADILGDLSKFHAEEILDEMEAEKAEKVRKLLVHADETAGGLMSTAIFRIRDERTAGDAIGTIRNSAEELEVVYCLHSVDESGRLRGVVTLKELLQTPEDTPIEDLLTRKVISVSPEADRDEVARLFTKYGFRSIPVVNDKGVLMGAIRFRAIVSAIAPELS